MPRSTWISTVVTDGSPSPSPSAGDRILRYVEDAEQRLLAAVRSLAQEVRRARALLPEHASHEPAPQPAPHAPPPRR